MERPSNQVRELARQKYVDSALQQGRREFRIVAGDVHRELRFTNRVPLVCSALKSRAFLEENRLELVKWEGPPSGLSTTVAYTYRFVGGNEAEAKPSSLFLGLRGIAKQVFKELGGGEAFLRAERDRFNEPGEDTR